MATFNLSSRVSWSELLNLLEIIQSLHIHHTDLCGTVRQVENLSDTDTWALKHYSSNILNGMHVSSYCIFKWTNGKCSTFWQLLMDNTKYTPRRDSLFWKLFPTFLSKSIFVIRTHVNAYTFFITNENGTFSVKFRSTVIWICIPTQRLQWHQHNSSYTSFSPTHSSVNPRIISMLIQYFPVFPYNYLTNNFWSYTCCVYVATAFHLLSV
jgi:hypothetical protein